LRHVDPRAGKNEQNEHKHAAKKKLFRGMVKFKSVLMARKDREIALINVKFKWVSLIGLPTSGFPVRH
jgi:hypothetical protein